MDMNVKTLGVRLLKKEYYFDIIFKIIAVGGLNIVQNRFMKTKADRLN